MTGGSIRVAAHAKVNLILRVLEREPGGFHRIETLYQRLALADDLTVAVTEGKRTLDIDWPDGGSGPLGPVDENLAWRGAMAYRDAAGWPGGWELMLSKRIPAGAGLGGGSSDAAAVLQALETLAPRPIGAAALREIGATLGSDVPFFLAGASVAIGRGRGDVLHALSPLPAASVVLVVPGFPMSTAEAYGQLASARARAHIAPPTPAFRDTDDFSTWTAIADRQANHFEGTVFGLYPELEAYKDMLDREGALISRLSGSGSTVFGLWPAAPRGAVGISRPPQTRLIVTSTY